MAASICSIFEILNVEYPAISGLKLKIRWGIVDCDVKNYN